MAHSNKLGKNDPCPCGSGKKYKNCCMNKKPRKQYVYVGYREPFNGITSENGQAYVHLPGGKKIKADATLTQTQYTRQSGKEKVVSYLPDRIVFNIYHYLASDFDVIFAIDTNSKRIRKDIISISCVLRCYIKELNSTQYDVRCRKYINIVFKNCLNNAERFGWMKLISLITSNPQYNKKLRIAIVTDHDLSRINQYNSRKIAIYENEYLPTNFTFLYATSDSGKDTLLNVLISECDKDSRNIIKGLEKNGKAQIGDATLYLEKILNVNT